LFAEVVAYFKFIVLRSIKALKSYESSAIIAPGALIIYQTFYAK
jgi:hypothetical protein